MYKKPPQATGQLNTMHNNSWFLMSSHLRLTSYQVAEKDSCDRTAADVNATPYPFRFLLLSPSILVATQCLELYNLYNNPRLFLQSRRRRRILPHALRPNPTPNDILPLLSCPDRPSQPLLPSRTTHPCPHFAPRPDETGTVFSLADPRALQRS